MVDGLIVLELYSQVAEGQVFLLDLQVRTHLLLQVGDAALPADVVLEQLVLYYHPHSSALPLPLLPLLPLDDVDDGVAGDAEVFDGFLGGWGEGGAAVDVLDVVILLRLAMQGRTYGGDEILNVGLGESLHLLAFAIGPAEEESDHPIINKAKDRSDHSERVSYLFPDHINFNLGGSVRMYHGVLHHLDDIIRKQSTVW